MRRFAVVGVATAAVVILLGSPALAKGPLVPIDGKLVITGPGLSEPIVLQQKVYWYADAKASSSELTVVLRRLGLLDAGPEVGWYELPPHPRDIGPAYAIEYYLSPANGGVTGLGTEVPLKATLYPYAPERPLVGLNGGAKGGSWWSAPPSLRTWLVGRGLPAAPVALPTPTSLDPLTGPPVTNAFPWGVWLAATGLLGMVVTGALAGRRAWDRVNRGV